MRAKIPNHPQEILMYNKATTWRVVAMHKKNCIIRPRNIHFENPFLVAQQLNVSSCLCFFLFSVCHIRLDQTKVKQIKPDQTTCLVFVLSINKLTN